MTLSLGARAAALALTLALPPASPVMAQAPPPPIPQNPQITVGYAVPKNPAFQDLYERLSKRQALEQLSQFLSPLRLPRKLSMRVEECGAESRHYTPKGDVVICYEYVDRVRRLAPAQTPPGGAPREVMIVGAFVQVVLHEVSLAVFDMLKVPVWGREFDAADKLAAYMMLQFGKDVARITLIGTAWFFEASDRTWTGTDFSDVRSPEAQRFYNYLCIAFGGDPNTFANLISNNVLPRRRAVRCQHEYKQVDVAFQKTIMPHVDKELMKRVRTMEIIKPEDLK